MLFARAEYAERLSAVRARMAARGVDVLIVDAIEHLGYLAGWHASGSLYHCCLVPAEGEPVMVCRRLDEPALRERSWLADAVFFADAEEPVAVVADTVARRGWGSARLGVELDSHYLPVQRYEALRAAVPAATFVDFSGILREIRLRKSPREIEYLRMAAGTRSAITAPRSWHRARATSPAPSCPRRSGGSSRAWSSTCTRARAGWRSARPCWSARAAPSG